ncbi:MAG: 2OG-Fe(II) oxygenase [Pseudomonadota bacterium]|nr:2OG-Fe(II) oxygenase [Pseudomonadota bacterium]
MLEVGDICPDWNFIGPLNKRINISMPPIAGRFSILIIYHSQNSVLESVFLKISDKRSLLDSLSVRLFSVTTANHKKTSNLLPGLGAAPNLKTIGLGPISGAQKAGAMTLIDDRGLVLDQVGVSKSSCTLVILEPNQHILSIQEIEQSSDDEFVEALINASVNMIENYKNDLEENSPTAHPPVLFVPNVLNQQDCRHLINIFETRGRDFVEPGHMQLGDRQTDCKMRIPDQGRQDRVDHWVVETETQNFISNRLQKRLFPEIKRAFNYEITRHERYRIARYEGLRGGEKVGHRDNNEASVAHRRFAVTINLNSECYEGAELKFPEFSPNLYKPKTGSAIVFSCSLLHEVVEMRSGSRFALLGFLFGEI